MCPRCKGSREPSLFLNLDIALLLPPLFSYREMSLYYYCLLHTHTTVSPVILSPIPTISCLKKKKQAQLVIFRLSPFHLSVFRIKKRLLFLSNIWLFSSFSFCGKSSWEGWSGNIFLRERPKKHRIISCAALQKRWGNGLAGETLRTHYTTKKKQIVNKPSFPEWEWFVRESGTERICFGGRSDQKRPVCLGAGQENNIRIIALAVLPRMLFMEKNNIPKGKKNLLPFLRNYIHSKTQQHNNSVFSLLFFSVSRFPPRAFIRSVWRMKKCSYCP